MVSVVSADVMEVQTSAQLARKATPPEAAFRPRGPTEETTDAKDEQSRITARDVAAGGRLLKRDR